MNTIHFILVLLLTATILQAQQYSGYTLIAASNGITAKLVDTNGATYKSWTFKSSDQTGYSTYLLPGKVLLRTVRYAANAFTGGGQTGKVQKVDWNGNIIWDYVYSTSSYSMHHDICPMPNGNVLLISYELKTASEATQAGSTKAITIWSEKIVEIQPTGATTGNVVWEWHVWDHLCQNADASKSNYVTSIVNNPQLFNINYKTSKDWLHMNGIDYNPQLDQIVVSSHNWNEYYVIDHSTTTAEAAGHSGGKSAKGGDLLYRWGNPAAYSASGTAVFNVVHDAHWIPQGAPNAGYIVAFNNGATTSASAIDMVNPPLTGYTYSITPGAAFAPTTYTSRRLCNGKSSNMGNSQQLPNGNMLICVALSGSVYEIDASGNVLWTYSVGSALAQAFRYSEEYVNGAATTTLSATATPQSVCPGESVSLSATLSDGGNGYTYSWVSNPTGFSSSARTPTATPTVTTTYTVTASSGTDSKSATVIVTVKPKPTITSIKGKGTTPAASSESYSVEKLNGATYTWTLDGGTISSGQGTNSIGVQWGTEGKGKVQVLVTNSEGCSTLIDLEVNIEPPSVLSLSNDTIRVVYSGAKPDINLSTLLAWTASCDQSWLSVTPTSGNGNATLSISVAANTGAERRGNLLVTAGTTTRTLHVIQEAKIQSGNSKRKVKFMVDMRNETINTTGVHIAGDFQEEAGFAGGDWQAGTTPLVKEAGGGSIYSTVVELPVNAKYEYKFLNGDQFYDSEFVPDESRVGYDFNDNRWFYADSTLGDTIFVGPLMYSGNAPYAKKLLRFKVDMSNNLPVSTAGVHVAGSFQKQGEQWNPAKVRLYSFGKNIYEIIAYSDAAVTHEFRYFNGDVIGTTETVPDACQRNGSRSVNMTNDTVLVAVCFSKCDVCTPTTEVTEGAENSNGFIVQPHPLNDESTLFMPEGQYIVSLYNTRGETILAPRTLYGSAYRLPLSDCVPGLYVLHIVSVEDNTTHTIKLLKQ